MSGKDDFYALFKVPVLLASFGGLPVPGAENLLVARKIFKKIFTFLSVFVIILLITTYTDVIYVTLHDETYSDIKYFLVAGTSIIPCGTLRNLYMIIRREEWREIISQWDTSFGKTLFPNVRRIELKNEKQFLIRFIKWGYSLMVFPVLVWALSPTITGKQAINSVLPWDHENSPTFELTMSYHFLYAYFLSVTWSANDSFLMINTSLVAAELRYLHLALNNILGKLKATENGKIHLNEITIEDLSGEMKDSYQKKILEIKSQLDVWIFHHTELTSFSSRLQRFYSPMVLLQYIFFVGFSCILLFYAASGTLPTFLFICALSLPCSLGVAMYVLCWFGERIASQNELLSQAIFHHDWFVLPKDIQYSLRFIIMRLQRRIGLSAFSLMPLNIKTFEKIMKWSYSFYMFIKDTNQKALIHRN